MSFIEKALKKVSSIDKGATHPSTEGNIVHSRQRSAKPVIVEPALVQTNSESEARNKSDTESPENMNISLAANTDTSGTNKDLDVTPIKSDHTITEAKKVNINRTNKYSSPKKTSADFLSITEFLQDKKILPPNKDLLGQNADEYRIIKRPILNNAFGNESQQIKHSNLLLVTSALPNEGKTNVAINIALSIAHEVNNTVLLIDADIAKADTSRIFDVDNQQGLIDLLVDDSLDIEDVLVETAVPGFKILPAGSDLTVKNELLASDQMRELLDEISNRYSDRMVVIDSPPLLVTAESRVICGLAGQIALVIEAARTPKPQAMDAVNMLDTDKPVNVIMNKTNRNFGFGQYGTYSYGYGFGTRRQS